jgi:hypothetical protein
VTRSKNIIKNKKNLENIKEINVEVTVDKMTDMVRTPNGNKKWHLRIFQNLNIWKPQ